MQKQTYFKKLCSLCLCILLVAAMAMFTTACTKSNEGPGVSTSVEDMGVYGEGENSFDFFVTDKEGKEYFYGINTDKKTVGEALLELGLIDGDEGPYGLYVKSVSGVTVDYDKDGMYWGFYVGREDPQLAPKGVDQTEIVTGEAYHFIATKG